MADASRGRRPARLLIAALAVIAFAAALRVSRTPHPRPRDPEAPLVIGRVRAQLALGPVLAAEAALQRAPNDPQARLHLADAYAASGDPVGAALALEPLLAEGVGRGVSGVVTSTQHPTPGARHPDLIARYARLCMEIGWLDEAAAVLQRLPAGQPRGWIDLASAYAEHGDARSAMALLKAQPENALGPGEWLEGAICWYHCRHLEQAVRWAQRALSSRRGVRAGSDPDASLAARGVLGRCLLAAGRPEAALEALLTDVPASSVPPTSDPGAPPSPSSAGDPRLEFWRGRAEARCESPALRVAGRERLARLAAADPSNGAAAFEAGRAFLLSGAPGPAVGLLSQAAVSGYQEVLCYELLSRAYAKGGRSAEALWARARGQLARGQFQAAAAALRRSVALDPTKPMASVDLARALDADGKLADAITVLQRAQKTVSGNLDVSLLKAQLLLHMERVPDVIRELETAATLDPRRANEPLGNLGTVYFDSQQYDRAIPPLERAVQVEEADAHSHFYLGRIYAREQEEPGRAEKAITHLLRAAQLQPDYSRPWMAAASVLQRMGYLSEAAACLRRAIAGESHSDAPYVRLGQLLQRQGRLSERRLILRRYAAIRDHDLTRTTLEKQTRDDPKDAGRRYALGDLLLREGQPEKALPELLVAAGLRPAWQEARSRLADACALLGFDDMREEAEGAGR